MGFGDSRDLNAKRLCMDVLGGSEKRPGLRSSVVCDGDSDGRFAVMKGAKTLIGHTCYVCRWFCLCASFHSAARGASHGGPRESHSIPKTARQPARAHGELHPASAVLNDTRIIAKFGVGFWKLRPTLGTRMEAPGSVEGDSAKWGSGCWRSTI